MTPEELKAYLDVVKGSGIAVVELQIPGKLVMKSVGTVGEPQEEAEPRPGPQLSPEWTEILNGLPAPVRR